MPSTECGTPNPASTSHNSARSSSRTRKTLEQHVPRFALVLVCSVFLLSLWCGFAQRCGIIQAAPVPALPPPAPPSSAPTSTDHAPDENDIFAQFLLEAVNMVGECYVRPVSRVDLLHTALTGLYDQARRPVPRNLRQRIEKAEKAAAVQSAAQENSPAPLVPALVQRRLAPSDDLAVLQLIREIRAEFGRPENLGGIDPLRVSCQAMLTALDPYSGIVTSKEDRRVIGAGPERDGFGLDVPNDENERVFIRDVLPGSPAQQAGLRGGDEILQLHDSDGRARKVKESYYILNGRTPLLKPQLGPVALPEPITITYRRPGRKEERQVTLEWRRFRPESVFGVARRDDNAWSYWLDADRKIAYVRLGNLVESTPDELSDILSSLCRDGMKGLILDLRWCPGGHLHGSARTAELFLGEATIATVRYRNQPEQVFRSVSEGKHNDFPMVALINEESTGGAEMIAAALQDHHRAVLVGQRTHGKGNVQTLLPPIGSVGIKVTSGTLIRSSGKPLHRFPDSKPDDPWGVHPDPGHEFRLSADASRQLRTWCDEQTMRPGSSRRRLPLDDPFADPQRNAAVEALTQLPSSKERASAE